MSATGGPQVPIIGAQKPVMPEIIIYPATDVSVMEGTFEQTDTSHFLRIILPLNGKEIRLPFNKQAMRRLGRDAQAAGGIAQANIDAA